MLQLLVFLAIALSEMASDIYVPGLPYIREAFSTSKTLVQLTVSLNLVGIASSSLFYGVLSDCYGRRKIFLIGFAIFTTASILCCFVQGIFFLISMRFMQGVGAGVAGVVGHASIKDVYSGPRYAQIVSRLGMVISLSPAVAPIVGGFILSRFDWHFLFVIVSIMAFMVLTMLFYFFQETLPPKKREIFQLSRFFQSYVVILSNKTFLVMAGIQACSFMWLWNEITNLPFLFITTMGMKVEHYGYFVTVSVVSYIVGTIINQRYIARVGASKMLLIGILMPILPDVLLLTINSFMTLGPVMIVLIWAPSVMGLAFIVTNSIAIALTSVSQNAIARASACLAFTQMGSGALAMYVVSTLFKMNSIFPISITTIGCSVIALIIYSYGYKNKH